MLAEFWWTCIHIFKVCNSQLEVSAPTLFSEYGDNLME
jgi:hypothetical protein